LKLNEELLKKMNLDKSKREINTPLNYEIFSVILTGIFLLYIITSTYRFSSEIKFLIPGLLTSLICLVFLVFSIIKTRLLSNVDYYNSSITDLQKSMNLIKQKYLQFNKYEFYIFPFFALVAAPILAKAIGNFDLYAHPYRFVITIIGALGLGYPLVIWIYKNWYEKKLRNTSKFLEDLYKFEAED
jgi:uncharacterized membrane protein